MTSETKSTQTDRIRTLNDELRKNFGRGQAVMTIGIAALGAEAVARIVKTVEVYDDFCHANDPYEEHDFGSLEVDGHTIFFKIDYFNKISPDAADRSATERVITIMLAVEGLDDQRRGRSTSERFCNGHFGDRVGDRTDRQVRGGHQRPNATGTAAFSFGFSDLSHFSRAFRPPMVTLPRHRPRQGSATARINKRKMPDDPTSVRRSVGADNGSPRELLGDLFCRL